MAELRKKLKLEKEAELKPPRNEAPKGCQFWVKRKQRFCKMEASKDKFFCGEHANLEKEVLENRILCPLDNSHTVFKYNLEKHLKVCNKRKPETLPGKIKPRYS